MPDVLELARGTPEALRLAAEHARTVAKSVVLYAGTNQASPAVEAALASSIGGMPAMGRPRAKDQPAGTQRVPGGKGRFGLRLGTQVIARKLYDGPAIGMLASLIGSVLADGPTERSAAAATDLALSFPAVSLCVGNPPCASATHPGEDRHEP